MTFRTTDLLPLEQITIDIPDRAFGCVINGKLHDGRMPGFTWGNRLFIQGDTKAQETPSNRLRQESRNHTRKDC